MKRVTIFIVLVFPSICFSANLQRVIIGQSSAAYSSPMIRVSTPAGMIFELSETSTTINTDLFVNSNTLFVSKGSTMVGVGTNSPTSQLDVSGGSVTVRNTGGAVGISSSGFKFSDNSVLTTVPYQLLASTVIVTATNTITFTNIPQTFNHLRVIIVGQFVSAANPILTVNGVSTGYDSAYVQAANNVLTAAAGGTNDVGWYLSALIGNSNNSPAFVVVDLPFYRSTSFNKTYYSSGGGTPQAAANNLWQTFIGSNRSTTAISSMRFTNGTYQVGTTIYIYGVN